MKVLKKYIILHVNYFLLQYLIDFYIAQRTLQHLNGVEIDILGLQNS